MTNIWLFVRKIVLVAACVSAAVADAQFLKSDTWAVTDALGRKALQDPDSVKLRKEKRGRHILLDMASMELSAGNNRSQCK